MYWTVKDNICSSAPHSQAREGARSHSCKERKRPTPVCTAEAVKPDARCSWNGHSMRVGVPMFEHLMP